MDKKDLIKYLGFVKKMEESVYTLEKTRDKLTQRIDSLGFKHTYTKPQLKDTTDFAGCVGAPLVITGIGIIPAIIIGYICAVAIDKFAVPFFITLGIIFIGAVIVSAIMAGKEESAANQEYDEANSYYLSCVEQDKRRVENELKEKEFLITERDKVERQIAYVKQDLIEAYSAGVIFETYRNFCAVSSFYEYIASGVCDTLDGPDGAMRLYRNEVLQGRIIDSLQTVVSQLEDIKQNQLTLYNAIERGNAISEQLLEASINHTHQNEQIIQNTAIEAHNSEITKNNMNMLTWITAANSSW